MAISGRQSLSPFDPLKTYVPGNATDIPTELGAVGTTPDGRTFKLGALAASGTTLSPNKLTVGPSPSTVLNSTTALTISAQVIGDTQVTLTTTSTWGTAITAGQFTGSLLVVTGGTGAGQTLQVKGNKAAASTGTTVVVYVEPLIIATAVTDTVNLWQNPYSAIIVCPSTYGASTGGSLTGVPLISIASDSTYNTYAWFQVGGVASVLNQGATTMGLGVAPSQSVAGAVATVGATTAQIGIASFTGADTKYSFVDLNIFS